VLRISAFTDGDCTMKIKKRDFQRLLTAVHNSGQSDVGSPNAEDAQICLTGEVKRFIGKYAPLVQTEKTTRPTARALTRSYKDAVSKHLLPK
jgi:hypothetical protein